MLSLLTMMYILWFNIKYFKLNTLGIKDFLLNPLHFQIHHGFHMDQ